jgi:diguanylate cyclase (GGDEF)-like protein
LLSLWLYLFFSGLLIVSGLVAFSFLIFRAKPAHFRLLIIHLALCVVWIITHLLEIFIHNEETLRLINTTGNITGMAAISFFLLFIYQYVTGKFKPTLFYSLIGVTVFFAILRITNPIHSLYLRSISFIEIGPYKQIYQDYGAGFGIMVSIYCLILLYIFFNYSSRENDYHRIFRPQITVSLYLMLFFIAYTLIAALNLHLFNLPISGHLCILSGLFFTAYTFANNLFNIKPLARDNTFNHNTDGILVVSRDGIIVDLNQPLCTILKKNWSDMAGKPLKSAYPELAMKMEELGLEPDNTVDSRQRSYRFVFYSENRGFDTNIILSHQFIKVVMHDITPLLRTMKNTNQLASTDPLTGVYNRRFSEGAIKSRMADEKFIHASYCFIVFDIDHFKTINDQHGHQTGDDILRELTDICRRSIRPSDIFGRYGGDEFILFLHNVNESQAWVILNRVHDSINHHSFQTENGRNIQTTISMGAILAAHAAQLDYQDVFFMADEALYQAKEKGRNQICLRRHTSQAG